MIQMIVDLAGCSEEDAKKVYDEVGDVSEAVDRLMPKSLSKVDEYINKLKPKIQVTEEQEWCRQVRAVLKEMDDKRSTSANQPGYEGQVESCILREETAQQSNCSQECHLPSLESVVQTQGTVCPSQSEYSCDLLSNVQK
jgi:hypothetical protein